MPAISFQSVCKTYPPSRQQRAQDKPGLRAVDDVTLQIEEGEFFGLLGPNGAGKTTLISMLAGLSRPTSGTISVRGHDVQRDYADARRQLGIVPQELVFDPFF
ncbi:MAG: ATP-binding cassette domain-containing protein, partial [Comamonadaceae bacterium]